VARQPVRIEQDRALVDFQRLSPAFEADVFEMLKLENAMAARKGIGAPSPGNVAAQLERWKAALAT
jgi:argininosuccinate lyase